MQNQEKRIFPIPNTVNEYTMRNTRYVAVNVSAEKKKAEVTAQKSEQE